MKEVRSRDSHCVSMESLIRRCESMSHIKQIQANMTVTGLFQTYPSPRWRLLEICAISPFGDLIYAVQMLRQMVLPSTNDWNAIIRGHAESDHPRDALSAYADLSRSPQRPDALSCSFALKACARALALSESRELHTHLLRLGFRADVRLLTTLVDAYAKSADLDSAQKAFDEMTHRDVAASNALICGFATGSRPHDALALFRRMCGGLRETRPNDITVVAALSACAQLGSLADGTDVHAYAREVGMESNVRVCNALIDTYAKCGSLDRAVAVFERMPDRSLVTWNTIIMGLAMHGDARAALDLFDSMRAPEPDSVTYLAALCACNHAGLVEDGLRIFDAMRVPRNVKHYGCIVDLLGRAGKLREAYDIIVSMPSDATDVVLWQTLLGACKTYGDIDLAERVSRELSRLGSNTDGDYVLLSNVYAANKRWADVGRVRDEMKTHDMKKSPGFSYMELKGTVHTFLNGDQSHPESEEIYAMVGDMISRIKAFGYVAETSFVLHDIGEEEKENALGHHSEKLAIAYGLLRTREGEEIVVHKNLRICGDCHLVAKLISRAYDRTIVVRDRARFHRFNSGSCSCGDYW